MLHYLFLAIILDYLYFKVRYSRPKGPPVWYGFPFLGFVPLLILPRFLYKPIYMCYLRLAPDVVITRLFGAALVTKGAAARAVYANEYCQSKPELRIMNYIGYMMNGKYGLVYGDGGKIDWRTHRKIDVAALYALPKREMVVKSSEAVDVFLRVIEKHEDRVWDCDHELMISKYQESANLNLGATFKEDDIRQFTKIMAAIFRSVLAVAAVVYILSVPALTWLESFLPRKIRPTLVARVYREALWSLVERRSSRGEDGRTRDFVQAALKVKDPEEAHEYLCAASLFLMAANTHSTHHTILSAMTSLATLPHIQEKLYREIQTVLGDEVLTLDHLDKMPYLRAVVMETNRLDSPFPFNLRYCTSPTHIHGFEVPGDVHVVIPIHAENWDPEHFPQPLTYRPERFLDEHGKYRRDRNLGLFGGGKRECPGKHINATTASVFISKILQHYEIHPSDLTVKPADTLGHLFPAPAKVPFRFIRRNKNIALPTTEPSTELSAIFREVMERV